MKPRLPLLFEARWVLLARQRLKCMAKLAPALPRRPRMSGARARWFWMAVILLAGPLAHALGQGCAQCLDSTRATPPAVQAAYRHAIFLLGGSGATVFVAGTLLLKQR